MTWTAALDKPRACSTLSRPCSVRGCPTRAGGDHVSAQNDVWASLIGRLLSPSPSIWNLWVHSRFEPSAYGFLVRLLAPEGHADYRFNGSAERESIEGIVLTWEVGHGVRGPCG